MSGCFADRNISHGNVTTRLRFGTSVGYFITALPEIYS